MKPSGLPACTLILSGCLLTCGCDGPQSALSSAGTDAERIAQLFWWMLGGALLIWIIVVGAAVYAMRGDARRFSARTGRMLIIGGGAIFPTLTLAVLLGFGLQLLKELRVEERTAGLHVTVSGEQWWWRVEYRDETGDRTIPVANEIRLPVDTNVHFSLSSPDVIHSFWIPSLGGKMDMIPGRHTRLVLEPTRTGEFRGVCAEYCGAAHALMAFDVVVMEQQAFAEWLAHQQRPAQTPESERARRGAQLFIANGCGSCHRIRGTAADGTLGPDLTHLGSRKTLAAGTLPVNTATLRRWIENPQALKPQARMPRFDMLPDEQLQAIAVYLEGLK